MVLPVGPEVLVIYGVAGGFDAFSVSFHNGTLQVVLPELAFLRGGLKNVRHDNVTRRNNVMSYVQATQNVFSKAYDVDHITSYRVIMTSLDLHVEESNFWISSKRQLRDRLYQPPGTREA